MVLASWKSGKKRSVRVRRASLPSSSRRRHDRPTSSIPCVKNAEDMKRFEETEDCFILDYDPYQPSVPLVTDDASSSNQHNADDVSVVAEKGQVACRDYPHPRYLCVKFPFKTTSHHRHCKMCYCYVCDIAAPCNYWTNIANHCNAEDRGYWKDWRNYVKENPQVVFEKPAD